MGFLAAAGAIIGGIAGAKKKKGLGAETEIEQMARDSNQAQFQSLRDMLSVGAGRRDVFNATREQRRLAERLGTLASTGGLPTEQDITRTRGIADMLFQGQREAQSQAFQQQEVNASRRAALSGRALTDPVLQNQLAQQQIQQSRQLAADQGSFATQLALQQPMQQLQFAAQRADVLSGLGQQAMQNRTAIIGLGQQLATHEIERRKMIMDAERSRGGGIGGFFKGAIGGAGAGMGIASGIKNLAGGGRPGVPNPGGGGGGGGGQGGFSGFSSPAPQVPFFLDRNPMQFSQAPGPFAPMTPTGGSGVINSPFTGNIDLFDINAIGRQNQAANPMQGFNPGQRFLR